MSNLATIIEEEFRRLQSRCALYRHVLHNQELVHPHGWGGSNEHSIVTRDKELAKTRTEITAADAELAAFIAESRPLMPADWEPAGHGLRCWRGFTGDLPLRIVMCDCPAGHEGPHREGATGTEWLDGHEPKHASLGGEHLPRSLWCAFEGSTR